jgi:hypothetical protein
MLLASTVCHYQDQRAPPTALNTVRNQMMVRNQKSVPRYHINAHNKNAPHIFEIDARNGMLMPKVGF